MGMTLSEKIIARAAGRSSVAPGEIVTCAVDLAMIHDSGGPRRVKPILDRLGVGVCEPGKLGTCNDCPDGLTHNRTCNKDGSAWSACERTRDEWTVAMITGVAAATAARIPITSARNM